jgi:hypothetical protein
MAQSAFRKFISTGSAINVDLGFIPAKARIWNANATAGEVIILDYFNLAGDAHEFWTYCINDAGTAVAADIVKKASGGYVSEYDSSTIGNQRVVTFDDTGGAAEDLMTCGTTSQCPINGDVIKLVESGGLPTNLDELANYYVIDSGVYGAGTFRISTTAPGRGTQSAVDFGSDGTPTNYFINVSNPGVADVVGGMGLTISASFSDDSDVIYLEAWEGDTDMDLGDSANW